MDDLIAFPELASANYSDKLRKHVNIIFRVRQAAFIFLGVLGGICFWFLGGVLVSVISVLAFHGSGIGAVFGEWYYVGLLFVALAAGGLGGYWLGKRKNFNRPELKLED